MSVCKGGTALLAEMNPARLWARQQTWSTAMRSPRSERVDLLMSGHFGHPQVRDGQLELAHVN